jgi:hypothetical protein
MHHDWSAAVIAAATIAVSATGRVLSTALGQALLAAVHQAHIKARGSQSSSSSRLQDLDDALRCW